MRDIKARMVLPLNNYIFEQKQCVSLFPTLAPHGPTHWHLGHASPLCFHQSLNIFGIARARVAKKVTKKPVKKATTSKKIQKKTVKGKADSKKRVSRKAASASPSKASTKKRVTKKPVKKATSQKKKSK